MDTVTCDTVGCNNEAEYYDECGNSVCDDCAEVSIEEYEHACWDDFERI